MSRKIAILCLTAVIGLLAMAILTADGRAAERSSRQYEVSIEGQKSDTVRMIEAYERLSGQYLTLVQQNLAQMSAADRDILAKLETIDKKLDDLSARLAKLETPAKPAAAQPAPTAPAPAVP